MLILVEGARYIINGLLNLLFFGISFYTQTSLWDIPNHGPSIPYRSLFHVNKNSYKTKNNKKQIFLLARNSDNDCCYIDNQH
jgi:hypothetical protein